MKRFISSSFIIYHFIILISSCTSLKQEDFLDLLSETTKKDTNMAISANSADLQSRYLFFYFSVPTFGSGEEIETAPGRLAGCGGGTGF